MKRVVEDTMTLLAGLGVGTALMYLLDPDNGQQRRQHLAHSTRETLGTAGDSLAHASHRFADHARSSMHNMSDHMTDAGSHVSDHASHLGDSLADYRDRIASAFGRSGEYLPDFKSMRKSISSYLPGHRQTKDHHVASTVGYTACGLALMGLGAGIAYLYDPDRGKTRRTMLCDKTRAFANDTGGLMRRTGKHLSNKLYGTAMEASRPIRKFRQRHEQQSQQPDESASSQDQSDQSQAQAQSDAGSTSTIGSGATM